MTVNWELNIVKNRNTERWMYCFMYFDGWRMKTQLGIYAISVVLVNCAIVAEPIKFIRDNATVKVQKLWRYLTNASC